MEEAARVPAGRAVPEVELDLPDVEAGLQSVDRHPCLDAEPGRDREERLARCRGQRPLARERLSQAAARPKLDQPARSPFRHAEPAADSRGEGGDRDVRGGRSEGTEVAVEVGVAEEQRPRGALPLGERQRLSLPPPAEPDDPRARLRRESRRAVTRAVVCDDDLRVRKRLPQRGDRVPDPFLLVARGDEDRHRCRHSSGAVVTSGRSGRTPSVAPSSIP